MIFRHVGTSRYLLTLFVAAGLGSAVITSARAGAILYVADYSAGDGTIKSFDGSTGAFLGTLTLPGSDSLGFPGGMIAGPDGNLYVSDRDNSVIYRFNGTTGAFIDQFITGAGGLDSPSGMTFDANGNLYVANQDSGSSFVDEFNGATGALISQFIPSNVGANGGLNYPVGLTFGPDGNLYIGDQLSGVSRFNGTTGAFIDQFIPPGNPPPGGSSGDIGLSYPVGLIFASGDLYVLDEVNSLIERFDANTGLFIDQFVANGGGLDFPTDMVFGPDGNLYVADGLSRVAQFNGATGAYMEDFISINTGDVTSPQDIAFINTGTPEPATFAMIALGMFGIGLRRRIVRARVARGSMRAMEPSSSTPV